MRSERKVPARTGEHDGERRGRASRMLDKVRRTDGSVRQPPGPGSTGATGTPFPLVRGLNAGVILRRRTGRNPRARPVIGAEDRNREGLYPTADLRRAETMKAKFFYTGIRVKDLEASVKFYTTLLGMKVRGRNTVDAAKGTVVELVCEGEGGNTLELNYYEKGSSFDTAYAVGDGLDHLAFAVKDLDAALAEAAKAGHPVVLKMQEPGSRYAYIQDPNGIWIELAQFG